MRHLTLLLALLAILCCRSLFAQENFDDEHFDKGVFGRLQKMADSLQWKAERLQKDFGENWTNFADSMQRRIKKYSDSLSKYFQWGSPYFEMPRLQIEPPEFTPDVPDIVPPRGRNIQPLPRVIPKRRDGIEIPRFPGWRIRRLDNLT